LDRLEQGMHEVAHIRANLPPRGPLIIFAIVIFVFMPVCAMVFQSRRAKGVASAGGSRRTCGCGCSGGGCSGGRRCAGASAGSWDHRGAAFCAAASGRTVACGRVGEKSQTLQCLRQGALHGARAVARALAFCVATSVVVIAVSLRARHSGSATLTGGDGGGGSAIKGR
jgi:hypothetical protein